MHGDRNTSILSKTFQDKRPVPYYYEVFFGSLQKLNSLGHNSRRTILFVLENVYCAPDTWTSIEDIDSYFSLQPRDRKFFFEVEYARRHCCRPIHVPSKFNIAIVITKTRSECGIHRNCFKFITIVCSVISPVPKPSIKVEYTKSKDILSLL